MIKNLRGILYSSKEPIKSSLSDGYYQTDFKSISLLVQEEQYDKAIELLLPHLHIHDNLKMFVYEKLGICYLKLGQYQESLKMWDLLASSQASYLYKEIIAKNRAICLRHLGKTKQAIEELKNVVLNNDNKEDTLGLFVSLVQKKYTQTEIRSSLSEIPSSYFWKNTSIYGVEAEHLFVKFLDFEMFVNISVYLSIPTNRMRETLEVKIDSFLKRCGFYEKFGLAII